MNIPPANIFDIVSFLHQLSDGAFGQNTSANFRGVIPVNHK